MSEKNPISNSIHFCLDTWGRFTIDGPNEAVSLANENPEFRKRSDHAKSAEP